MGQSSGKQISSEQTRINEGELVRQCYKQILTKFFVHQYSLECKSLKDEQIPKIIQSIQHHEQSKNKVAFLTITLYSNYLGEKSCLYLSRANLRNLIDLSLARNKIGDRGCKNIVKGDWSALVSLSLIGCGIGEKGCAYLSKGQWRQLQQLKISKNKLGKKGTLLLFASLPMRTKMRYDSYQN